jgi:hypothetical protein
VRPRRVLVIATLATVIALVAVASASAASLDPRGLVLRRDDFSRAGWIPSGRNGYRSADQAAQGAPPGTAARFVRYGFRRGYDASFGTTTALVGSTAYVFATTAGAKRAFGIYREAPPAGTKKIPFGRVGDASLGFRSIARPRLTAVVWLNGPVLSIVLTGGLTDRDTLALAKTQSRRVVAAVE